LYNLSRDHGEEHNLYHLGDPQAMQPRLNGWISTIPKSPQAQREKPDCNTIGRLKSLGYAH
jgi:hypothetical protein